MTDDDFATTENLADENVVVTDSDTTRFVVMHIANIQFDLPSPSPLVHLVEDALPYRQIVIPIGLPEAQALGSALHEVTSPRPMTHELFASVLKDSQTDIVAVRLTSIENGVYFAEIDLMSPRGRTVLDCRPSDALILALRQTIAAPILCDESLLPEPD